MPGILRETGTSTEGLPLPGTPWTVRFATATRGRAALELYEDGTLLDVLVDRTLAPTPLRGARRTPRHTLAWGHLPPDGGLPLVGFHRGARHRVHLPAFPAAAFWLATAPGSFTRITLAGSTERLRAGKAR
jgi:hypothetical protein